MTWPVGFSRIICYSVSGINESETSGLSPYVEESSKFDYRMNPRIDTSRSQHGCFRKFLNITVSWMSKITLMHTQYRGATTTTTSAWGTYISHFPPNFPNSSTRNICVNSPIEPTKTRSDENLFLFSHRFVSNSCWCSSSSHDGWSRPSLDLRIFCIAHPICLNLHA